MVHSTAQYQASYRYAAGGFALLALGYLLRGQVVPVRAELELLLGVFPNLLGSFATPYILLLILSKRFYPTREMGSPAFFFLLNLITLGVSLLIEIAHVALRLGSFDPNDMTASIIGGSASMALFLWTNRRSSKPV
jgi:hypothetical protein